MLYETLKLNKVQLCIDCSHFYKQHFLECANIHRFSSFLQQCSTLRKVINTCAVRKMAAQRIPESSSTSLTSASGNGTVTVQVFGCVPSRSITPSTVRPEVRSSTSTTLPLIDRAAVRMVSFLHINLKTIDICSYHSSIHTK